MKKIILIILGISALLLLVGLTAQGSTRYAQNNAGVSTRDGNASISQSIGITNSGLILDNIVVKLQSTSTSELIMQISCLTSSSGSPVNCSTGSSVDVPPLGRYLDSKPVSVTDFGYYTFDFTGATSTTVSFSNLKFWSFALYYKTGTSDTANFLSFGSPDDAWAGGECGSIARCGNVLDLFFNVTDDISPSYNVVIPGLESLSTTTTSTVPFSKSDVENACDSRFPNEGLWNNIANGFCRLLLFVALPSTDAVEYYKGQTGILRTKFPFAYFYDVINAFDNVPISSTTTTPTLDIPIRGNNITFIDFGMIPSSTHDLIVGDGSLFYEIMQYSIWLAFGWFAFVRIKSIVSP